MIGGFAMFLLGLSFAWKCVQAAFYGKVAYWSGLAQFGWLFMPVTVFLSPLIIHLPYDPKKGLIHERQQLWVHMYFGPLFFVLSLMFMTSGADMMNLPGSTTLNYVLTLGNRPEIPPCIVYSPPFHYKFPFLRKAAKVVYKAVTYVVPMKKDDIMNAYERNGEDVGKYSMVPHWFDDDEDVPQPVTPVSSTTTVQAAAPKAPPKRHK